MWVQRWQAPLEMTSSSSLCTSPHTSLSLVSLLPDLTVILIAVVGGSALLLFALGLIICFVKKK